MTYNARGALSIYTKSLAWGGSALLTGLLWYDRRWMEQPGITLLSKGGTSWPASFSTHASASWLALCASDGGPATSPIA